MLLQLNGLNGNNANDVLQWRRLAEDRMRDIGASQYLNGPGPIGGAIAYSLAVAVQYQKPSFPFHPSNIVPTGEKMVEALAKEVNKLALEVPPKPAGDLRMSVGSLVGPTVAPVTQVSLTAITSFGQTKVPGVARKLFF